MTDSGPKRFLHRVRRFLAWQPSTKKEAILTGVVTASLPLAWSWWYNDRQNLPLSLTIALAWFILLGPGNLYFRHRYPQRKAAAPPQGEWR